VVRIALFPYTNNDLKIFVIPWFRYMIDNGGLASIKALVDGLSGIPRFSYSPPYLYLLLLASPLTRIFSLDMAIKIVSVIFDYLSAFYVLKIIEIRDPAGWKKWLGFFSILFAPTVFITSAYWGQFDGIFGAFLIMALYYFLRGKNPASVGLFFSALLVKVQAAVLAPVYFVLFLKKQIEWRWLLLCPLIYLLWIMPAFLFKYPLDGVISTLFHESKNFDAVELNAPNIFALFPHASFQTFSFIGLVFAAFVCGLLLWSAIRIPGPLKSDQILLFAVLVSLALPFVLPKMHERYFFTAALISILLPFFHPRLRLVPLALQVTSLLTYTSFLRGYELVPLVIPAVINLIVLIYLVYFFFQSTGSQPAGFTADVNSSADVRSTD
jgi:Gpi18-like mannosyltransferase